MCATICHSIGITIIRHNVGQTVPSSNVPTNKNILNSSPLVNHLKGKNDFLASNKHSASVNCSSTERVPLFPRGIIKSQSPKCSRVKVLRVEHSRVNQFNGQLNKFKSCLLFSH